MDFLKKNLVFTLVVALCLISAAAGTFLAFTASGKVGTAERSVRSAQMSLDSLLASVPSPTVANLEASESNIADLASEMAAMRANLEAGAAMSLNDDGIAVMAGIQQYITDHRRKVSARLDQDGEEDPIVVGDNFAFGFEQFLAASEPFEDAQINRSLDKQRQVLAYLVDQLVEANPDSITSVERELVELDKTVQQKGFSIESAISARVPGAVDTMAFSITFTGFTDVLRGFLNNLATFELPIVVRSIEVERPSGAETVVAPTQSNNIEDIFGIFGGGSDASSGSGEEEEAQQPVITDNISQFKVIVEFIEIVLPEETNA